MKITIDIPNKTIQIHGSFTYEEYLSMHKDLNPEWKGFKFEIVPVYVNTPWIYEPPILNPNPFNPNFQTTCTSTGPCYCSGNCVKGDTSQTSLFDDK